jgi:hypothetical protein
MSRSKFVTHKFFPSFPFYPRVPCRSTALLARLVPSLLPWRTAFLRPRRCPSMAPPLPSSRSPPPPSSPRVSPSSCHPGRHVFEIKCRIFMLRRSICMWCRYTCVRWPSICSNTERIGSSGFVSGAGVAGRRRPPRGGGRPLRGR